MVATDALNGLWVSHMLRAPIGACAAPDEHRDRAHLLALRLAIAPVASALDVQVESWGVAPSVAVIAAVAVSYVVAMRFAARECLAQRAG
jgi:hypothetical protein